MLNPEARRARARLAAYRRWHPGDDLDQLTRECLDEIGRSNDDEKIDDLVDAAPRLTALQASRIRKLFDALDGDRD